MIGSTWQERNTSGRKETVSETEEQRNTVPLPYFVPTHTHTNLSVSAGMEYCYSHIPQSPGGVNKILSLGMCHRGV